MNIEMRVLPFCGITAPRLPFEKSYSAFIVSTFLPHRASRRNQPVIVAALCPHNDEQFACGAETDRHEALFAFGTCVFDRKRKRILQNFGGSKRNRMSV